MSLIRLQQAKLEFADQIILSDADLSVEKEERICLIGRNGAGKTTLMKILLGQQDIDSGQMHVTQGLRISVLSQDLPDADELLVSELVGQGLAGQQQLIEEYETLSMAADGQTPRNLQKLEQLQSAIEQGGGWNTDQQIESTLSQLGLDGDKKLNELSGGWRRRVALAKALVSAPDLLLLDEPTNHLDINTIEWLEGKLLSYRGSIILITHDRTFLQKLATRIVEVDRGQLISWPGNFQNYLKLKEKADEEEDRHNALFDKRLAQEEGWIREGIKARRTRNEGRVRALEAMRKERAARIKRQGRAQIQTVESEQSGRKVIEVRGVSHGYNGETLIKDFSARVMRGDRIGIVGNNGVGKSTLLSILLGTLTPDKGSVKIGAGIQLAYFDQLRERLDKQQSVADFVADGKEHVTLNGKQRHVISYLQQFLFSPKRSRTKISALSGGECNRVLLAKLFMQPSNVLILDEPSNDLDVEMLEALEQRLVEYPGTLLLVSHDRQLLDNVVTSTFVFEENGKIQEYVGGYSDWQSTRRRLAVAEEEQEDKAASRPVDQVNSVAGKAPPSSTTGYSPSVPTNKEATTLSFTQKHELEKLPEQISSMEAEIETLNSATMAGDFYQGDPEKVKSTLNALEAGNKQLEKLLERWYELEGLAGG